MSTDTTTDLPTALAVLLFVSPAPTVGRMPGRAETLVFINDVIDHVDYDTALAELAYAYGDHPETAVPRMRSCLTAVEQAWPTPAAGTEGIR